MIRSWTGYERWRQAKITIGLFPCLLRMIKVPWSLKEKQAFICFCDENECKYPRTFTHFGFEVSVKIHRDTLSRELDIAVLNSREGG